MSLEFESEVAVLDKFGKACEGSLLDWRRKCRDEIIWNIPMVLVSQHFDNLPYRALISDQSSINFRELWESEGGTDPDCCPSTANTETEICDFQLPELQFISIGVEPRCYWEWEKEFCKTYPRFKACSPFVVSGGSISLRPSEEDVSRAFMSYIKEELAQAIWTHLYRTAWIGTDAPADQWNGLMYYLENGIQPQDQTAGGCDYPLAPTIINWAEYIHGAADAAAGVCAGPGDTVLEVGDADRPGDAPVDNIVTIYPGLSCEMTIDITGMDVIDFLVAWLELVVNEWGVDVLSWFLGIPRNQFKCLAEVAACKQACANGDCRHLLTGDNRDAERATREAGMIAEKVLRLYPYEQVAIPMRQSDVLRQTNRLMFIPERIINGEGEETWWMLWAWRNRAAERENFLSNVPAMREELGLYPGRLSGDFEGLLYDGEEFQPGRLLDNTAWEWLSDRNCNSVRWWNNAETGMVPQCPHLWLVMDGVCCDKVLTLPCCGNSIYDHDTGDIINPNQWIIVESSCTDEAAAPTYTSTIEVDINDNNLSGYIVSQEVDVLTVEGYTRRGTITSFTGASPNSTMQISFDETVTCADNGGIEGGYVRDAVGP